MHDFPSRSVCSLRVKICFLLWDFVAPERTPSFACFPRKGPPKSIRFSVSATFASSAKAVEGSLPRCSFAGENFGKPFILWCCKSEMPHVGYILAALRQSQPISKGCSPASGGAGSVLQSKWPLIVLSPLVFLKASYYFVALWLGLGMFGVDLFSNHSICRYDMCVVVYIHLISNPSILVLCRLQRRACQVDAAAAESLLNFYRGSWHIWNPRLRPQCNLCWDRFDESWSLHCGCCKSYWKFWGLLQLIDCGVKFLVSPSLGLAFNSCFFLRV